MERKRNRLAVLTAAVAGLCLPVLTTLAAEPATEPSKQELIDRLNAMQSEIESLKASQRESQTTLERKIDSQAATATAEAVQRDAASHSQLLDVQGFTAGYDSAKGFVIRSENADFLFHPWAQLSIRNISNYREDQKNQGSDDLQNGFELRRTKFGIDGNLWGDEFKYVFIWATDRKSGTLGLEEAWIVYKLGNFGVLPESLSIQAGQFKNYFAHESMASSKKIFAVERSLVNDLFTGGDNFIQGVGLLYNEGNNGGPLQAGIVVNDGSNDFSAPPSATSRNFQDFPNNKWDFGVAGRLQYKIFGKWKDYEDFTAATSSGENLLVVGGGVDYSEAGDFGQFLQTVDAQYKAGPISLYGAVLGRSLQHGGVGGSGTGTPAPAAAGTGNFYDWGFVGKAGYLLNKQWEVFGQYSYIQFDGGEFVAGTETTVHEFTIGVNYYLHGHSAKLTVDGTWLPNGSPLSSDGGGILAEPNGRNELLLRAQFQLLL